MASITQRIFLTLNFRTMGVLSFIKRFLIFVSLWVIVFGAICTVFPFQYFNQKFTEAYNLEQSREVDHSQELATSNQHQSDIINY